ncbi:MFS transporter [Streptomyces sp. NPDC059255]|uniref:MFS transporter n=1 Tax=Streptomyces sp. NPDC059255 TaxID=3346793 RepID=UPI0036A56234
MIVTVILTDVQGTAFNPLVVTISTDLHLTAAQVSWILNGYTLMGAACAGILSRLGDAAGPRRVLLPVLCVSLVGSVICALASSFLLLIVGRVLIGFIVPSVALIWGLIRPRATQDENRRLSFLLGTSAAAGVALALVLGGWLLRLGAPWQALFWISAVLLLTAFAITWTVPEAPRVSSRAVSIDWYGGIGLALWLVALLLGLSYGPSYGWTSARVAGSLTVSVVVFALWTVQQIRTPDRLMAFRRSELRQMVSGYTSVWSIYIAATFMYTFVPILLQAPASTGYGFGLDVLASSLPLTMLIPAAAVIQLSLGRVLAQVGPRWVLGGGAVFGAAGFFGQAFFHGSILLVTAWVFVYALGLLACYVAGFALTTASGRQDNIAITVGLQYAGGNIVISISTAVVLAMLVPDASGAIPHHVITSGLATGGVIMLGLGALWFFLAPKHLVDEHAAPAVEVAQP